MAIEKDRVLDPSNSNGMEGAKVAGKFRQQQQERQEQQQNEGWENIPPYRQLKVLLVEDDDSTRHVVAALLRNCGYQVVSTSNGLQAWALLDDRNREFDLVLTDVVMPGLSGIGLLSKIMRHEKHKKIPVIMMSSHDSTNVVFKCLSKGAADFLVKPVRKNELKNLWQHSWRRSQSSSGSESETGRGNHLSRSSGEELSSESGTDDVRISDQSDNGSATQSSCTRKVAELESPRRCSRTKQEAISLRRYRRHTVKDSEAQEELDALQTRLAPATQCAEEEEGEEEEEEERELQEQAQQEQQDQQAMDMEAEGCAPDDQAADLIGSIANDCKEKVIREVECERGASNSPEVNLKDGDSSDPTTTSKLELSLRSSCEETHHGLKHSGASAFSRYNTLGSSIRSIQTPKKKPNLTLDGESLELNRSCTDDQGVSPSPKAADHQNNVEGPAGYFMPAQGPPPGTVIAHPVQYAALVSYDHQHHHHHHHHQRMPPGATYYYAQPALPPWQHAFSPQAQQNQAESVLEQQQRSFQQAYTNILAHHHHYHMEHQHDNNGSSDMSSRLHHNGEEAPGCCGSTNNNLAEGGSNQFNGLTSGSSHGNGSMCGSNNGSNGFTAANTNNHNSNNHNSSSNNNNSNNNLCGNGDSGSGNYQNHVPGGTSDGGGGGQEQNRSRREAALNKFRQKRKERCFEKKVRYQSRKRLAEQRPRVRGQFVSQAVYDSSKPEPQHHHHHLTIAQAQH